MNQLGIGGRNVGVGGGGVGGRVTENFLKKEIAWGRRLFDEEYVNTLCTEYCPMGTVILFGLCISLAGMLRGLVSASYIQKKDGTFYITCKRLINI